MPQSFPAQPGENSRGENSRKYIKTCSKYLGTFIIQNNMIWNHFQEEFLPAISVAGTIGVIMLLGYCLNSASLAEEKRERAEVHIWRLYLELQLDYVLCYMLNTYELHNILCYIEN